MKHKKSVLKILSASCDCFEVSHGMAGNVSAMSSGGFGTTHYQNTTNDNRKH